MRIDTKIVLGAISIVMVICGAAGLAVILWAGYGWYKLETTD